MLNDDEPSSCEASVLYKIAVVRFSSHSREISLEAPPRSMHFSASNPILMQVMLPLLLLFRTLPDMAILAADKETLDRLGKMMKRGNARGHHGFPFATDLQPRDPFPRPSTFRDRASLIFSRYEK